MKKIVVAGVVSAVLALVVGAGAGWGVWHHYAGKGKPTAVARAETVETLDESKSVFVTLPETIVTLHDNNGADHYLSAELVMVVASDKEAEKIKHQEPLYQSIAVECLTEMKFEDLRGMKISAIRKLISDALKKDLQRRKMSAPYKDLLVKKWSSSNHQADINMLQDVFESEEFAAAPVLTPQQESHYLQAYLPLVRKVVRQLAPQCNCIIDRQDMEQTALMGLLNAIRRYGLPDEGFAGYAVHRIRGAILDELRALDWRPRQLRQKYHQMKDLIRETRKKLGHEPEWSELAVEGISHEDYLEYQQLEGAETLASLDELLNGEGPGIPLAGRELEDQFVTQQMLQYALSQLSEKEQLILSMYYQHEMNLKEIALVLGLTEARICQLNKQIAQKIRDFVYPN
ncbi:hypothetical protein ECZC01_48750 [Escherichia coli]|nr:hypothetical protein ECZC01_48750 [Escherichia coli]